MGGAGGGPDLCEPAPTGQTKAEVVLLDSDWSMRLCLQSPTSCFLLLLFSPVCSSFSPCLCHLLCLSPSSSPPTTLPSSSSPLSPPPPPSSSSSFSYPSSSSFSSSCTLIVLPALLRKPITIGCLARGKMLIGRLPCGRREIGIGCLL